ncbi:calcium-binding protein [Okeania hirsuta]|uniref:Calcium-binding protein n=2 Tax=Okeania TaxID=1458928 RepID=A0A3N6PF26_9CYAN|nr:calcium-binding protein [Okeania hirsuta]RQH18863.1 calcium-binding protein [Okeania hirsuta]RQH50218.1 calcium-binding protein [Okeania hirsuta]
MVLIPDFSDSSPRLLGTNGDDNEILTVEQATSFPGGVLALSGDDIITGSSANDLIFGGEGKDELFGEGGNDILYGNKDTDFLNGGLGDDILYGGKGTDLLNGGDGNDTLIGDAGVDIYKGGLGSDVYVFRTELAGITQDLSNVISLLPGIPSSVELPNAIITDFNSSEDIIGLTGGMTKSDLIFEDFNSFEEFGINTNLILPFVSDELELLTKADISVQDLDPNNDGVLEGTAIKMSGTNQLLGYVLNTTSTEIAALPESQFISVNF